MLPNSARSARKQSGLLALLLTSATLLCLVPWMVKAQSNFASDPAHRSAALPESSATGRNIGDPVAAGLLPQKLSLVPDSVPVHLDSATLVRMAHLSLKPEEITVDTRPADGGSDHDSGMFNNEWTLVKSGKHLTVQAWATADQALKVGNGDMPIVFSNPPSWLPAKNLVPVEFAFYRFQTDIAGVSADGKRADLANSAAQVSEITPSDTGIEQLVTAALSGKNLIQYTKIGNSEFTHYHYEVTVRQGAVHLTGQLDTLARKQKATQLAQQILARFDLPFPVSNELKVGKLEQ